MKEYILVFISGVLTTIATVILGNRTARRDDMKVLLDALVRDNTDLRARMQRMEGEMKELHNERNELQMKVKYLESQIGTVN